MAAVQLLANIFCAAADKAHAAFAEPQKHAQWVCTLGAALLRAAPAAADVAAAANCRRTDGSSEARVAGEVDAHWA